MQGDDRPDRPDQYVLLHSGGGGLEVTVNYHRPVLAKGAEGIAERSKCRF